MHITGLGFDLDGFDYLDSLEEDFPINFATAIAESKIQREERDRFAMAERDRLRRQKEADFWNNDPHYDEIVLEQEAAEAGRVWEESEALMEEREREFDKIQGAPLRHHKKRR